MSHLSLNFLGTFQVALDNVPLKKWGTDKTRALLAYLAVEAGIPHRREKLEALLWPEAAENAASRSLRQALNLINRALNTAQEPKPFLSITRSTVTFVINSNYDLDVDAFTTRIEASNRHRHRRISVCSTCIAQLKEAITLYRGDFLAGLTLPDSQPFEEWRSFQQEQYHQQALLALYALSAYHEGRKEYEQAIIYARKQISMEPWREEAHRQLMRSLALNGQRSLAIAQYKRCQQILDQEFGILPEDATQVLYRQIKTGGEAIETLQPLTPPHNLPAQVTPFIGREEERQIIAECLADLDCRLITLIGLGGSGKTRLALQAAIEALGTFQNGVYFISVAPLKDIEQIEPAILEALQIKPQEEIPANIQLLHVLKDREILFIIDNFDHLVTSATRLAALLQALPRLKIIVTSRERLNLQGEHLVEVNGLPFPTKIPDPRSGQITPQECEVIWEEVQKIDAVQLFIGSATRVRPSFKAMSFSLKEKCAIVQICQMLLGNPLAIELAATWVRTLTCQEISKEIAQDYGFLTAFLQDIPEHHRNLHTVFDHSWELLSPEEKQIFSQLSVFQETFSYPAAAFVTNATLPQLLTLLDKSLLQQSHPGRYSMHELLHQYAAEKLSQTPESKEAAQERHSTYYAHFLAERLSQLQSDAWQESKMEIHAEMDNVRPALQWAIKHASLIESPDALTSLAYFYDMSGWFKEGAQTFKQITQELVTLQATGFQGKQTILALLNISTLHWGHLAWRCGDLEEAMTAAAQALEGAHDLHTPANECWAELLRGQIRLAQGDYKAAYDSFQKALALAQSYEFTFWEAISLCYLGDTCKNLGQLPPSRELHLAKDYYQQALLSYQQALHASSYHRRVGAARVLSGLGDIHYLLWDYPQALDYYQQALTVFHDVGEREREAWLSSKIGMIEARRGDYPAAQEHFSQMLQIEQEVGNRVAEAAGLYNLGLIHYHMNEHQKAYQSLKKALTISQEIGDRPGKADELTLMGHTLTAAGKLSNAEEAYTQGLKLQRELGQAGKSIENIAGLAKLALMQNEVEKARFHIEEILEWLEIHGAEGLEEILFIYLTSYHVLMACDATAQIHAQEVLTKAHTFLQKQAAIIQDPPARKAFLENITIHQEILQIWEEQHLTK